MPETFVVHVSGDNRYQLFADGQRVSWGPARGDLANWRYETVELHPHLKPERNVLAAGAWNFGDLSPLAQMSHRTGFRCRVTGPAERAVDTGPSWKVLTNEGKRFSHGEMMGYFVVGPGEFLHGDRIRRAGSCPTTTIDRGRPRRRWCRPRPSRGWIATAGGRWCRGEGETWSARISAA